MLGLTRPGLVQLRHHSHRSVRQPLYPFLFPLLSRSPKAERGPDLSLPFGPAPSGHGSNRSIVPVRDSLTELRGKFSR